MSSSRRYYGQKLNCPVTHQACLRVLQDTSGQSHSNALALQAVPSEERNQIYKLISVHRRIRHRRSAKQTSSFEIESQELAKWPYKYKDKFGITFQNCDLRAQLAHYNRSAEALGKESELNNFLHQTKGRLGELDCIISETKARLVVLGHNLREKLALGEQAITRELARRHEERAAGFVDSYTYECSGLSWMENEQAEKGLTISVESSDIQAFTSVARLRTRVVEQAQRRVSLLHTNVVLHSFLKQHRLTSYCFVRTCVSARQVLRPQYEAKIEGFRRCHSQAFEQNFQREEGPCKDGRIESRATGTDRCFGRGGMQARRH